MARPISPQFLVHNCTYEKYLGKDAQQVISYDTAVTLKRVKFEPPKSVGNLDLGEFKQDRYLLIVDGVNSKPTGIEFTPLDRITYSGTALTIRTAEPLYGDSSKIHHWEITVG